MAEQQGPVRHHEQAHPREATYVKVALVLAVITAFEIVMSYVDVATWVLITVLVLLSVVKFTAVVGYFMHLKFDNPALRKPFITGLFLALAVYTIVLLMFALHSTEAA